MASAEPWAPTEPTQNRCASPTGSEQAEPAEDAGIEGLLATLDGLEREQGRRGRLALAGVMVAALVAAALAIVAAAYLVHAQTDDTSAPTGHK